MSAEDGAVSHQDVVFAGGICRIELRQADTPGWPSFVARMWLLDADGAARPLVLDHGDPAEVHGQTEALALSSAITYLERRLGALSEYAHRSVDLGDPPREGKPIVIDHA